MTTIITQNSRSRQSDRSEVRNYPGAVCPTTPLRKRDGFVGAWEWRSLELHAGFQKQVGAQAAPPEVLQMNQLGESCRAGAGD